MKAKVQDYPTPLTYFKRIRGKRT